MDDSPLEEIVDPLFDDHNVTVHLKRDDLLFPFAGNKSRKLKYAYKEFLDSGMKGMITMGGPFSNHIHAFSGLCRHYGVRGIVLVRGEVDDLTNPVLKSVRDNAVDIMGISREKYAQRYSGEFDEWLKSTYPEYYLVPEGGASRAGLQGCVELGYELSSNKESEPDIVFVPAGTGTTACGIAMALGNARVIAISALREKIIRPAFEKSLSHIPDSHKLKPELNTDYHFGGFAKWDHELIDTINIFEREHNIALDPLYTGKMVYALRAMIRNGQVPSGSNVVAIHTGGRPGRQAFNYRHPGLLEALF